MRCYAGLRVATAATNLLPAGSVYAIANRPLYVLEVGVFNTTTTATQVGLSRLTSAGTPGTGATEMAEDPDYTPVATVVGTHTSTGPTITGQFTLATLGAAAGAGVIWTFGNKGLIIPQGTANGIGLTVPTGTGQVWDCYFVWEE